MLRAIYYKGNGDLLTELTPNEYAAALQDKSGVLGDVSIGTHHELPIQALDRVWDVCSKDVRHFKRGADHVLYILTDELIVDYMQVVESLDEEIEIVEDEVIGRRPAEIVQRIFALKRATLHLRRVLSPLREVLNKLARDA